MKLYVHTGVGLVCACDDDTPPEPLCVDDDEYLETLGVRKRGRPDDGWVLVTEENVNDKELDVLRAALRVRPRLTHIRHALQLGADPNLHTPGALSPLYRALTGGSAKCFELLVSYGANNDYSETWGAFSWRMLAPIDFFFASVRASLFCLLSEEERFGDRSAFIMPNNEEILETRWRVYFRYSMVQKLLKLM